ncbi:MAG: cation diffusion facilitator family transporter [Bacteroidales bacterium]
MDKTRAGYQEGIVSILTNTALFGLKLWAGIVSGSIAITADAWHTLSDSLSSIFVIAGARLASRKPDKDHPFGHGRWEHIASIFIGILLGIIAYGFMTDAVKQFQHRESASFGTLAIVVTIVSIVTKELLARYALRLGTRTDNNAIKADGWHHRSDALSSIIILVGIFFTDYFWWIDSLLGAIVAIMIFYAAYSIIRDSINKLLGEQPSEALIGRIQEIIKVLYRQDLHAHHFHIHNYVTHKELTFHIKLKKDIPLKQAHRVATHIEETVFEELGVRATIHVEPIDVKHKFD